MMVLQNASKRQQWVFLKPVSMIALASLAACGGSGGGSGGGSSASQSTAIVDGYAPIANKTASTPSNLQFVAITNDGTPSTGNAGALNHGNGRINSGLLAGTLNSGRTQIGLPGGSDVRLTNEGGTEFLRMFQTDGLAPDRFGVVGVATELADMPDSGDVTYNGRVRMDAFDGAASYALSGDARITADFDGGGSVDSRFSNLSGTRNDTQSVSNVGTINIDDAVISGSSFSGGTVSTTGAVFDLSGTPSTNGTNGQFFGPDADEVGGTVVIKDGDLEVFGVYAAD
jgi:hypothetical protein